ncbi:MAG: SDR family NAD(P)-dependent oxidoreductase [Synechococcaceae cyanobacterium SM2_3_1]|nr:SDR family NAD(P)-dependent oxidoreductase [Synechococcaceae cyanobacterium SM2_3_1]
MRSRVWSLRLPLLGWPAVSGGADDPEAFWKLLESGQDAITDRPPQRYSFALDPVYAPQLGGFLDQIDQFDAPFFHISPREASSMDPQQRLLLEESWHALEHAGLDPASLVGSQTGVFIGIFTHDYELLQVKQQSATDLDAYFGTGTAISVAAGRLAYVLGLQGPALAVDTACSSSLTALHLACRSLQAGDCQLALVAGVNLILSDELNHTFAQAGMLAPDGRCKTFDASANGYGRSEGCGVVVLKPLLAAMQAGDRILGVIRGSALNQDGASNGLTAPSGLAQEQVIRQALASSDLPPAAIDYVEAHGTGTALGDPVEIQALQRVYGENRPSAPPLVVGSVKTNVGHTEAAAGMAGLIKVLLALQHEFIPPHLHFQTLNPHIQLADFPLQIPTQGRVWQRQADRKRRAGISAFGFSGTNAHVILEEAPSGPIPGQAPQPCQLLPLSAPTPAALQDRVQQYVKILQADPEATLADLCYSSQVGRSHWPLRLAVVCHSPADLREQLQRVLTRHPGPQVLQGIGGSTLPQIAFLFTGQGSQYEQMGRQLYEIHPVFRRTLEQCQAILEPLGIPLLQILYPERQGWSAIHATAYTQPVLFALEYSLAQLWRSWGIEPAAVMGHSVGEYVAACVAGVVSLEAGLQLITARGRLMQALPSTGGMAAILASPTDILQVLATYPPEQISLAAMNGPHHGVISGRKQLVEQVSARFASQGIKVVPLQVSHAFHSPCMEPMLKAFATEAEQVQFAIPQIPLISNLTGQKVGVEITEANYWVEHIRQPVRFAEGMASLQAAGYSVFVECGPRPILLGMGRQCLPQASCHWIPSLHPEQPDWQHLLQSVGKLYTAGINICWEHLTGRHRKIPLPTYPFQRQILLAEPLPAGPYSPESSRSHPSSGTAPSADRKGSTGSLQRRHFAPGSEATGRSCHPSLSRTSIVVVSDLLATIPREDSGSQVPLPPGQWILFADHGGIGQQLKHKLQSQGQHCTLIFSGKQRQQQSETIWQIRPDQVQDIHHVFQAAQQRALPLHGLVYLWGLDLQNLPLNPTVLAEQQKFLWGSVLAILRSLGMEREDHLTKLWLVTRDSVATGSGSLQGLVQTCLWGLGKTLGLEHPEHLGGLLDLGPEHTAPDLDLLTTDLLQPDAEQQLAYRQGQRYGARLQQGVHLPHRQITFSPHRTYLITGGLGHLGLQVAGWLVQQGVRHLLLISRRSPASQPQTLLDQWRQSGVQITTLSADIASAANLSAVLTQMQRTLPPLGGIFHAAGVITTVPLRDMTCSEVLEVIRPKILGAWNLHHLTLGQDLECFVCFPLLPRSGDRGDRPITLLPIIFWMA